MMIDEKGESDVVAPSSNGDLGICLYVYRALLAALARMHLFLNTH